MVYLEIKQRVDRVTQKRRIKLKYKDALAILHDEQYPSEYDEEDVQVIDELLHLVKTYNLKPSVITTYDRQAFF